MELASPALAFAAGLVSIFSPCVLPLLPVVLGTAVSQHRLGPLALAAGLALAFLVLGLSVTTIGLSLGLDTETFRGIAAILLTMAGAILVVPRLQTALAQALMPVGDRAAAHFGSEVGHGLAGSFALGLLLGAIWAPCVGPTLGAASVLAAQGRDLPEVALILVLFAIGTVLPLLVLGLMSREVLLRWRSRMLATGRAGKITLGLMLIAAGVLTLTGYDKSIETELVTRMPAWLTELTSRF